MLHLVERILLQHCQLMNQTLMWWEWNWFLGSLLSLDISELNFAKNNRGKKPSHHQKIIPPKLTGRHCVPKLAVIFDIATMKMDL